MQPTYMTTDLSDHSFFKCFSFFFIRADFVLYNVLIVLAESIEIACRSSSCSIRSKWVNEKVRCIRLEKDIHSEKLHCYNL